MFDTRKSLMIVDDDVPILTVLSERFSELGYSVRSAEDGFSALSAMETELPDILLSELNMPGISGVRFLSRVRRMFPSVRVVAMSSSYSGSQAPRGVAADAFYAKGSRLHLLTEAVDAMIRSGRPTVRLGAADLFGFAVFEKIPSHPVAGQRMQLVDPTSAFLVSQGSEAMEPN